MVRTGLDQLRVRDPSRRNARVSSTGDYRRRGLYSRDRGSSQVQRGRADSVSCAHDAEQVGTRMRAFFGVLVKRERYVAGDGRRRQLGVCM